MKYAVLVCGPAGAGKSTFCSALMLHAQTVGRVTHLFNLDPAAEEFGEQQPSLDIRDLVGLEDVMQDLDFGPNGGLIYCFESVVPRHLLCVVKFILVFGHIRYLLNNLDWLHESIGDFEDDFLIIDCPGMRGFFFRPFFPHFQSSLNQSNLQARSNSTPTFLSCRSLSMSCLATSTFGCAPPTFWNHNLWRTEPNFLPA